jgi:hypothetical protein
MLNLFYAALTFLAILFGIYFGVIKGEPVAFGLGVIFFWTGTVPWIISIKKAKK